MGYTKYDAIAVSDLEFKNIIGGVSGATAMQIKTKEGQAFFDIDTTNKRIGIGDGLALTAPGAPLHIEQTSSGNGLLRLARSGTAYVDVLTPSGTTTTLVFKVNGSTTALGIVTTANAPAGVADVVMGSSISSSTQNFIFDSSQNAILLQTTAANSVPASGALLELNSTTKVFLPPRVTTTQRTAMAIDFSTHSGAIVYDKTLSQLFYMSGAQWVAITGVA